MGKLFYTAAITLLFLSVIMISCRKDGMPVINDEHAKIIIAGYACGPACDAIGYAVEKSDGSVFYPVNLAVDFRVNNLPVKITYKRTGNFPASYAGPYYEQINILQITQ